MNNIDKIRNDIIRNFNGGNFRKGDLEVFQSPSGQFRIDATSYWLKEPNCGLTKVEIYDQKSNERIFDFFVNETRFIHGWVSSNNTNYLICAENIFGGQTIIDLTNRKMNGYSPNEEGFIWTDFHLSPDGKTLATIGCFWACPFVIKLFDFSDPFSLPLKEIKEINLLDNDEVILGWIDNETLQLKGFKREREPEYFEGGSFRMKVISEINVERQIKINEL